MVDDHRTHKRIIKPLTMQFCLAGMLPQQWDISHIENISVGGVKFKALSHLNLVNKTIFLRIGIPALAPDLLELKAIVLDVQKSIVRAKFINLTTANKEHLSVLEKMINAQGAKKPHF